MNQMDKKGRRRNGPAKQAKQAKQRSSEAAKQRSSEAAEGKNRRWMIHVVRSFVR
jgi:hypothetical protein